MIIKRTWEVSGVESFVMEVAGVVVGVQPLFESTKEYCRPYLSEKEPEFFVDVTPEDLVFQQELLEQEAIEEGLKIRKFTEPFRERATIQRKVADYLFSHDTLMLHGSTVAVDGKAYLFTAPCKTGKSTHTRLWRELFGDRAVMVNDDMPFLKITPDGVLAYGSPWSGKHGLATNICVPLQGICFLNRGRENTIRPLKVSDGMDMLLHQVHTPVDAERQCHTLVENLVQYVPLWEMDCNMELDAARVSYGAMSGIL